MKNIFTLLILSTISVGSFGQNFSVSANDTIFYGEISDSDFASKFILYNDSTDSFPMTWEVESESMATGWEFSICDPANCSPIGTVAGAFNLPTTATNRIMNIHYFPNENYGESTVVVKLWEDEYPDEFVLLEWTGIVSAVGINDEVVYNTLIANFDAISGSLNINYDLDLKMNSSRIVLYDLAGNIVDEIQLIDHIGNVSIGNNLSTGTYVYALVSNDQVLTSKKVVVQ